MNDYFEALQEQKLSKCPYHRAILAGDETGDLCDLEDIRCSVALGAYDCEEWAKIQAEWLKEKHYDEPKPWPSYRLIRDKRNGGE